MISVQHCTPFSLIMECVTYQKSLYLAPQDSIIYATMVADLKKQPEKEQKWVLSRDKKAFDNDDDHSIKSELEIYNCRYIGNLAQGLTFIQHTLKAE